MKRTLLATLALLTLTVSAQAQRWPYQGVVYSMQTRSGPVTFVHHRDGKSTSFIFADGRRGTLVTHHCGNDFCTYLNGRLIRRRPRAPIMAAARAPGWPP